jgi:hypothetical protein
LAVIQTEPWKLVNDQYFGWANPGCNPNSLIVSTCRVGRWLWHCRMFLWSLHFPSEGSLCVWAWIPKNGVVGPGNSSGTRRWQTKGDRWCFLRLDLKKISYVPRGHQSRGDSKIRPGVPFVCLQ